MVSTVRRTTAAVAALAAGAAALYAAGPGTAGAAPAAAPAAAGAPSGWLDALAAAGAVAAPAPEVEPAVTGARTLRFTSRLVRSEQVDVGARGESPGDFVVFEERLFDRDGNRIGRDAARCELILTAVRCEGTFTLAGQGSFEVAQAFGRRPLLAVTGGTGDFRNVRGQARIVGGTGRSTEFEVRLLP